MPKKIPNRPNDTALEGRLAKIAEMDRRGHTQYQIAKAVGISQPAVSGHLKTIRQRYVESMLEDRKEMVAEKLEQYREVRRVAWQAYMLSLKPSTKRVVERMPEMKAMKAAKRSPRGGRRTKEESDLEEVRATLKVIKVIMTKEGRLPSNEFLHTVLKTLDAERELLGLDPDRRNLMGVFQVPWEQLYGMGSEPDPLEARIEEVLALPAPDKTDGSKAEKNGAKGSNGKHTTGGEST